MKVSRNEAKYKHVTKGAQYSASEKEDREHYNKSMKHQTFFLFTRPEGSTRPSLTKQGYIISHSDWSKSAAERVPPSREGMQERVQR
jgi:hypothetical protein